MSRKPIVLPKLAHNDIRGAVAAYRLVLEAHGTVSAGTYSMLMRMQDDPTELVAALAKVDAEVAAKAKHAEPTAK